MNGTILVLDDSLTVRMDLSDALQDAGYDAVLCATGADARAALASRPIDVVILDVLLPDVDGIEFIREVRASRHGAEATILVLSSEADVKDRIRGLQTGADDYIGKPYDVGYVLAKIGEALDVQADPADLQTILVIDDSATSRALLSQACEEAGYTVVTAADGVEGLRLAAARRPDAVIVDGVLPGIDGPTVIRRIRLDEALRGIPCVLMTASDDEGAEIRALESGADAFVHKEEDAELVLAKLAAVLRRSAPSSVPAGSSSLLAPKKVLAVDDSPTFLHEVAGTLRDEGYEVVLAHSGEEALELVAVERVDCILLDLVMPGIGGEETCRRIKAAPVVRDVPLIMLTALEGRQPMIAALGAGADDYISKSSDVEVLSARVRAQLRRKQFEDENRRVREELLKTRLEAAEARAARELAESRAMAELERRSSQAFLDSVVRNIPDMIFVKDAETLRFEAINPAGEELLGIAEDEVVGRADHELFPAQAAAAFAATDREVLERGAIVDIPAEELETDHRGVRVLHTKKIPIYGPDGRARYVLGISEDVTERQRAEEELRQAKVEADRANQAKSEFLSRMSHELRTPLNAVLGYGQLLELSDLDERQRESVHQILRGGTHLMKLINEVLDVSRIEAGELSLSLEPVDVEEAILDAAGMVRPMATSRDVAVVADRSTGGHVLADRQRLKQVLLNLLSNAIKYNRDGGTVTIGCTAVGDDHLRLSVADTGPGIAASKLDRLFSPFDRLGAEQTEIEGTGLGLALTRRLVEAMGGEIGVASVEGEGTTFWVEVRRATPVEAPVPQPDAPAAVGATAAPVGTVLFVEDNLANVRLVERIVEMRPHASLLVAMQGQMGIELATVHQPDLVLLDLNLPDLGGEVVLRRLRADPRTRSIPVVIVSADASPGQAERLLAAGAAGYVTKPFRIPELLALLDGGVPAGARVAHEPEQTVDPETIEQLRGLGDRDQRIDLLTVFETTSTETIRDLRTSLHAGDLPTAARLLHSLKGGASSFGALALTRRAVALEELAVAGHDPADLLDRLADLEHALADTLVILGDRLLAEPPPGSS
jgi:PAS domain S-box-containing protein